MNDLSWMIYWAGVFDAAGGAFVLVASLGIIPLGFFVITRFIAEDEQADKGVLLASRWFPRVLTAWIACVAAAIFTPSADTVYAMAASEVGEEIVKSETASKATKALNAWLDRQIAPEKTQ